MLHNLTLQERRREEGRMLEEWLYLRPRGENRGRKIDGEEVGVGWDTGTRRAEEEVGGGG